MAPCDTDRHTDPQTRRGGLAGPGVLLAPVRGAAPPGSSARSRARRGGEEETPPRSPPLLTPRGHPAGERRLQPAVLEGLRGEAGRGGGSPGTCHPSATPTTLAPAKGPAGRVAPSTSPQCCCWGGGQGVSGVEGVVEGVQQGLAQLGAGGGVTHSAGD